MVFRQGWGVAGTIQGIGSRCTGEIGGSSAGDEWQQRLIMERVRFPAESIVRVRCV